MRVVSWNIELGQGIDRAIDVLTTDPDLKDADLILLQEMDDVGPQRIAEALGLAAVYRAGCKHGDTGKPFGNAILVRGEVGEAKAIRLPHLARFMGMRRIAVQAPVTVRPSAGGDPHDIQVWSVHAEISTLPHRRQVAQYREVADQVVGAGQPKAVVGGDFNTASGRSIRGLVEHMERAHMVRVLPPGQQTFFRFGRPFELDHLFAKGFDVIDSGVTVGHHASDHDPVWALLSADTR